MSVFVVSIVPADVLAPYVPTNLLNAMTVGGQSTYDISLCFSASH